MVYDPTPRRGVVNPKIVSNIVKPHANLKCRSRSKHRHYNAIFYNVKYRLQFKCLNLAPNAAIRPSISLGLKLSMLHEYFKLVSTVLRRFCTVYKLSQ